MNLVFFPVYVALLHYPIRNREGKLVTTAVTNMDIHDISRSARTFGVTEYFLVTPLEPQQQMVGRILDHWRTEKSRQYHPDRFEALERVRLVANFENVKDAIRTVHGQDPEVVMTDASPFPNSISYADYRRELEERKDSGVTKPLLLVFGTGWGIAETFYPEVHRILAPVYGPEGHGGYNHLSVRSAVAIILDRLFGL